MAKLTLTDLATITGNETSAINAINANNALIETALENTLSRDGTTPNAMGDNLDMNNFDILNVDAIDVQSLSLDGLSIVNMLPSVNPRGSWVTLTEYAVGDLVLGDGEPNTYICYTAHTSGTFASDKAANWLIFASPPLNTETPEEFNGDSATVAFTLSKAPNDEKDVLIFIDGVFQQHTTYSISSTTLTFTEAPPTGTGNIAVWYMTGTVSAGSGNVNGGTADDNAVARYNANGTNIQNSGVLIDDSNNVTGIAALTATGAVTLGAASLIFPASDGTANQVIETDGAGNLSFATVAGGAGDSWGDVVDADIIPDADGTRDLGATATRFAEVYTDALFITNNVTVGGTVDGRDLATDGTKLDGIEASADVTDVTNVTSAGALMDSELASIADVKALDQSVVSGAAPTFTTTNFTDATNKRLLTDAQESLVDNSLQNISEDTTPQLGGSLDCNGQNMTDVQEVTFDITPDTDHTATGFTHSGLNAGETTTIMDLLYLNESDGEWHMANAVTASSAEAKGLLAIGLAAGTDTTALKVAMPGSYVRDDTWAWTIGDELYVGETNGTITATAPSTSGDTVRKVGFAVTADVIYFNPDPTYIVV